MCDCGTTGTGSYFGKIGGQFGDRFENYGMGLLENAKKRFKSFTGLGDYKLTANSLVEGSSEPRPVVSSSGRQVRIKHKEYLGDVMTGQVIGAFSSRSFDLNPANEETFPWLSTIAAQYDQWRPMGVIFEFRSTASDTSTLASIGSVIMATEYDLADNVFNSKAAMLNSAYSNEARMATDALHGLECDPNELQHSLFYTLPKGRAFDPTIGDLRDYVMARFTIATQGGSLPINSSIGSLYVHYDFEFYKEQVHGGVTGDGVLCCTYEKNVTTATTFGNAATGYFAALFNGATRVGRDLGFNLDNIRFGFPGGSLMIPIWLQGATIRVEIAMASAAGSASSGWVAGTGPPDTNGVNLNVGRGDTILNPLFTQPTQSAAVDYFPPQHLANVAILAATYQGYVSWTAKMDDVMFLPGAFTIQDLRLFPFPATIPVGTNTRLMLTVYPRNQWGSVLQ